jgi:hypothetical protein
VGSTLTFRRIERVLFTEASGYLLYTMMSLTTAADAPISNDIDAHRNAPKAACALDFCRLAGVYGPWNTRRQP